LVYKVNAICFRKCVIFTRVSSFVLLSFGNSGSQQLDLCNVWCTVWDSSGCLFTERD